MGKLNMMKTLLCLASLLVLTACNQTDNSTNTTETSTKALHTFNQYKKDAINLVSLIEEKASDEDIIIQSANLVKQSQTIISAFKEKFPQCEKYLTAVSSAATIIPSLPLAEIETDYHADGKLPKLNDANCYHAKDLLVHPATVQAIAAIGITTPEQREDAKGEIVEVIEHFSQVEQAFKG